ncbi:MAG: VOC family protein [Pseudomonadota bacterium]
MAQMIHAMIRVFDLDRSIPFYQTALGLDIADRFDFDDFVLVYLRNNKTDFELELTLNKGRQAPYDLGDGYGHIAVCVDDVKAEHARISAAGIEAGEVKEFYRDGTLMARFFFIQDPDGYKIEILERHGRYC